jgi:tetratricopeptide (TPR) repeat protein
MFEIGERVRIKDKTNDSTRIAIVAIVNDDNTIDLNDEDNVDIVRVYRLQDFELSSSSSSPTTSTSSSTTTNALIEKEYGNILFGLKDYCAAIDRYKRSLSLLDQANVLSIGSEVLVESKNNYQHYRSAMISDINDNTYDVIYDETFDEDDDDDDNNEHLINEESDIPRVRLFNLSSTSISLSSMINEVSKTDNGMNIQKAVLMNLAKCYYQLAKYGFAIRFISLYLTMYKLIEHNNDSNNNKDDIKKKVDALWIKSKSFLNAGRPNLAKKIVTKLQKYDKQRAIGLMKEIDVFVAKRFKDNKQLARHIANWVDTAMSINEKSKSNNEDDIYIKDDIND